MRDGKRRSGGLLVALPFVVAAGCADRDEDPLREARAALERADYATATQAARQAAAQYESGSEGADPMRLADALDVLSEALWRSGKVRDPEARASAERALGLRESRVDAEDPALVPTVTNLGSVFWMLGQRDQAAAQFERAYQIQLRARGPEDPLTAKVLCKVGMVQRVKGDYERARALHAEALAVLEAALEPDHPDIAGACEMLGADFLVLGDYARALALQERALAIRERRLPPNHPDLANSVGNTAVARYRSGDYAGARPLYRRASEMWERIAGPDDPILAANLQNEAVLLAEMGDRAAARSVFERALAIREKAWGAEHPGLAIMLANLGELSSESGDMEGALAYLARSLALRRAQGPDYPPIGETLNKLGLVNRRRGDFEQAARDYGEALALFERTLGPQSHAVAQTLDGLAGLHVESGALETARRESERALDIRVRLFGGAHPEVGGVLDRLARIGWQLGDERASLARAEQAAGILNPFVAEAVAVLPERHALLFAASQPRPEEILFSGLLSGAGDSASRLQACWSWTLNRRGTVLDALALRRRFAVEDLDAEGREVWESLRRARFELASLFVKGPQGDEAKYVEALAASRHRKELAEARLAELSLGFAREQERAPATLEQLEAAAPRGTALVEIVRVEVAPPRTSRFAAHDVALILEAGAASTYVDLGPSSAIDELVEAWLRALHAAIDHVQDTGLEKGWRQAGERLRETVWDPIAARLEASRDILLVPAGALFHVDLRALPRGHGFLIDEGYDFHLITGARQLVAAGRGPARHGRGLLAIGSPDFDVAQANRSSIWSLFGREPEPVAAAVFRGASAPCASMAERRWDALPAAAVEVAEVEHCFAGPEGTTVVTGRKATEANFRRLAPGRRIIHVATHGFFLEECGAPSRLPDSPLLYSGLVLAGAHRTRQESGPEESGNDGILTAEEVAALDLEGVELAVLSACDTGRGFAAGSEGVGGLRRAFEVAGAQRLVMSTWRVPDRAAQRFMRSFYADYLGGASVREAVAGVTRERLAQERESGRFVHPFLWAGMVSAGAWD